MDTTLTLRREEFVDDLTFNALLTQLGVPSNTISAVQTVSVVACEVVKINDELTPNNE